MFTPKNEQGVVLLFGALAGKHEWQVVSIQSAYPDAVLCDSTGEQWIAEFEFMASNFLNHQHDHRQCDLIVCWENDYPDSPIPIIELKSESFDGIVRATAAEKAQEYWMRRCLRAESALRISRAENSIRQCNQPESDFVSPIYERVQELRLEGLNDTEIAMVCRSEGHSGNAIAKELSVNPSTVSRWFKGVTLAALPTIAPVHTNGFHKAQEA